MLNEQQQDRAEAIKWASDFLGMPGEAVLILDTETTGFEGEVIELAIINLKGEVKFNGRFNPVLEVEEGARRVHGLGSEQLKDCPVWTDKAEEIRFLLGSAYMVLIYNAQFDVNRLIDTCSVHNIEPFTYRWDCVMMQYAAFVGDWNDYFGNYRWQKLPAGDHSALGDCQSTLAILKKMAGAK